MDITLQNYPAKLPFILTDLSNASFVAIDLKLSGIPNQQLGRFRSDGRCPSRLPTLQQRYEDVKRAAEKYHILQLGITCALEKIGRKETSYRPTNAC